jgi:hypothetical protein
VPTDKAAKGAPAEKPAERVDDPDAINLHDTWSRIYLARGCGAMVQVGGLGRGLAAWLSGDMGVAGPLASRAAHRAIGPT